MIKRKWDSGLEVTRQLVTGPVWEPLDVAFVRDEHLRVVNGTVEDGKIGTLITSARMLAEEYLERALVTQTWSLVLSAFPSGTRLFLPFPPLRDVTEISYIAGDGTDTVWGSSPFPYTVIKPSGPRAHRGYITPAYGEVWPTTRVQDDAVTVTFECGYADAGSQVGIPQPILDGMLLVIGELYKIRSESVQGIVQNSPAIRAAKQMWELYRLVD